MAKTEKKELRKAKLLRVVRAILKKLELIGVIVELVIKEKQKPKA